MGKKKYRQARWEKRGILKREENRHKSLTSMHPQVRREFQKPIRVSLDQFSDILDRYADFLEKNEVKL